MKERFVILGNGIAGLSAARAVRELLPEAKIKIVAEEKELPYRRPLLSKTYLKSLKREDIQIVSADWYERADIQLVLGRRAVRIEAEEKRVHLSDGQVFPYDACIYALGAEPVRPPFYRAGGAAGADLYRAGGAAGADLCMAGGMTKADLCWDGVLTVRTMADIRRLKKRLILSRRAVVIGGGSIGLEIAWEIEQMGCRTVVLESAPWLMGRLLDPESAGVLARHIEKKGILVYPGVQVESLTGERSVTGVRLADGRHIPADLVVVCCGTRAVAGLAREAGIACGKGVLVDDFMETKKADIYGAGDCIQWRGAVAGRWSFALASGRLAGYNAAVPREKRERLASAAYPLLLSGMGISLFAMGDVQAGEGTHRAPGAGVGGPLSEGPETDSVSRQTSGGPETDGVSRQTSGGPEADGVSRQTSAGPETDGVSRQTLAGPEADGVSRQTSGGPEADGSDRSALEPPCFQVGRHEGEGLHYEKYFYQDGRLTGAVLFGDLSRMGAIRQMLLPEALGQRREEGYGKKLGED